MITNNDFEQIINTHLACDDSCKECVKNKIFKKRAKEIHGDKFDYLLVKYINSQTHVKIKCVPCDFVFNTIPNNHLRGKGCKKCATKLNAEKRRKPKEQFIKECEEKLKKNKFSSC